MFNPYGSLYRPSTGCSATGPKIFAELLHEAEDYASGAEWRQGVYWNVPERFDVTPMLGMIVQSDRLSEELGRKSAEAYIPLTVIVDNAG